jgi:two-component system, LuxR family, response regulator FixJ
MSKGIGVALVEDDDPIRDSLQMYLQMKGLVVTGFDRLESCLAAIDDGLEVDCFVTDVRLPGRSGLDLQGELKARHLCTPVILITGHGDIDMAVTALKGGAYDFIEKPCDERRLIASINEAVSRARELQDETEEISELQMRLESLSARQRQVMKFASEGLANKEIAARLEISPRTVEMYRAWVMEKMGASNLAELVRIAMRLERANRYEA